MIPVGVIDLLQAEADREGVSVSYVLRRYLNQCHCGMVLQPT
jgi:hypothetical protein